MYTTNTQQSLVTIKPGTGGLISHILDPVLAARLFSMGVLPGTVVEYIRKAPLGGGCYVRVGNALLALRKQEASSIIISQ